jgi:anti-anti-sigma regulatory factor
MKWGLFMAANFRMSTRKKEKGRIVIQMSGDFDGSSAWELIHKLNECSGKNDVIEVDTDGLKTLAPFGKDILISHLSPIGKSVPRYVITGSNADFLSDVRLFRSSKVER